MDNPSDIERIVMRRVRVIRLARLAISPAALAALILGAALVGIRQETWVHHVIQNAPAGNDLIALSRFYLAAFEHTRLSVQALSLLTLGSVIYLARAAAKPLADLLIAPLTQRA